MYRVLIAEDERLIRDGLQMLIPWEQYGFVIADAVENGAIAMSRMEKEHYDLVITDVRMPQMSGLDMLCAMREHHIDTAVFILSGYRDFEYAREGMRYGVREYLLKPIDTAQLTAALQQLRSTLDAEKGCADPPADSEQPQQIKRYVALHYMEPISMRTISEELHYNESYLGRLFLRQTGMPFRDYLNLVRTGQAAELLAAGHSVTAVAEEVGYRDVNYFCRTFKKIYGKSPSRYKK